MPASWDSDTWIAPTPSSSERACTVPRVSNRGFPDASLTISASSQFMPVGAPSAFASASFAANLAASDAGCRSRSSSVNSRGRMPGVRASDSSNRLMSTTSIPTPTITASSPALLDGDGLGEVAGLVDVVSHAGCQLAGEDLQGYDGDHRLQQGGNPGKPDHGVGVALQVVVVLLGDHDRAGAAGSHLLDPADHLVVQEVPTAWRHHAEHRQVLLDERDGAVLQLACREALRVDVGELLELQGTLESDREARVP